MYPRYLNQGGCGGSIRNPINVFVSGYGLRRLANVKGYPESQAVHTADYGQGSSVKDINTMQAGTSKALCLRMSPRSAYSASPSDRGRHARLDQVLQIPWRCLDAEKFSSSHT
jgi:hypothetical protein